MTEAEPPSKRKKRPRWDAKTRRKIQWRAELRVKDPVRHRQYKPRKKRVEDNSSSASVCGP